MILYFSGTGNSKYIATILAKELNEQAISANELIKNGKLLEKQGERIIFLSPVYAWRLPRIFQEFIERCSLKNCKAYFVFTCGDGIGNAEKHVRKFCHEIKLEVLGVYPIVMPENYIAMFKAPPKEEIPKIIESATLKAKELAKRIKNGEPLPKVKKGVFGRLLSSKMVNGGFYAFCVSAKRFYVTDKCISCGKCQRECVYGNVIMTNGKPVWGKNCTHCMACICKCPTFAIEYGKKTKNKDRYVCPGEH